jgi:hypothetical protein
MSETVVIATYSYRHQAEYAANILASAGVPAFLHIDDAGGIYAGLTFANPARIVVRREDRADALDALRDAGLLPDEP